MYAIAYIITKTLCFRKTTHLLKGKFLSAKGFRFPDMCDMQVNYEEKHNKSNTSKSCEELDKSVTSKTIQYSLLVRLQTP